MRRKYLLIAMMLGFCCSLMDFAVADNNENTSTTQKTKKSKKKKKKNSMKKNKEELKSLTSDQRKALRSYLKSVIDKAINVLDPESKNKKSGSESK